MSYNTLSFMERPVIPYIHENASREWLLNEADIYKRLSEIPDDHPTFKKFCNDKVGLLSDALKKRYHVRLKNRASRQN